MLYDIAFLIFAIFYLPALIFRGKLHADFGERLGVYSEAKRKALASSGGAIWIQAVSVGEVAVLRSFVPSLRKAFPEKKIVLSTITKTGNDLARRLFSNDAVIIYFPLDFSGLVNKVLALVRPSLYIMVETEIWPNFLKAASRRNARSVIINGRISDRSYGKYMLARLFLRNTLEKIDLFCMQSEADASRMVSIGAPKDRVVTTGNMKFDVEISKDEQRLQAVRERLGLAQGEKLFVAGSTHRGEERTVLSVYKKLTGEFPGLKLLLAPRHIVRVAEIESLVKGFGFESVRFSSLPPNPTTQQLYDPKAPYPVPCLPAVALAKAGTLYPVYILDTIGELKDAYAASAAVFVGGSLVRHGGQNPIEPAAFGNPVLFGPHMFNFREIAKTFLANDAAVQVIGEDDLRDRLTLILKDDKERSRLGDNAKSVVSRERGATERNIQAIEKI